MSEVNDNQKYNQLIDSAYNLFMKFGLKRVSVEEICAEAKISKMTFYKHFKNKNDLAKFILTKIFNDQMKLYRKTMAKDIPYHERIKEVVLQKHKSTELVSHEFFTDIWRRQVPEITKHLENLKRNSIEEIINDFSEAQKRGDIRKDIKLGFIMHVLNNLYEFAKNPEIEKMYDNPNELIMEITNFFFYGIMSENKSDEGR